MFLSVRGSALGRASNDASRDVDLTTFERMKIHGDAPWARRAGLHTVELGERFYPVGGRTPVDPETLAFPIPGAREFWADVGVILGGRDFCFELGASSPFFNDVWRFALPAP